MTINFIIKGENNPTQIYVRLRDKAENVDATSKTGISISRENFKSGEICNKPKSNPKDDALVKSQKAEQVKNLDSIEDKLINYKRALNLAYNNRKRYEVINAKWIKEVISPKENNKVIIPNELISFIDFYLINKKGTLKESTLKKIKTIRNRFNKFTKDTKRTYYLQEINKAFRTDFNNWCLDNKYHKNTIIKSIKVIVTICNYAFEEFDVELHPHTQFLSKGKEMRYKETDSVYLTLQELKKIESKEIKLSQYDLTRDWLLISCYTAQRISDFMRFDSNDIVIMDGNKFLDVKQEKTGTPILVYLNDVVLKILDKYDGKFPPLFSDKSKASNENIYNKLVKETCRICGINEMITCSLINPDTNRAETKTLPKYKFISSHIGRRSYATNYYGKINTALLIGATGHKSEQQFLRYVKKPAKQNAKELAKAMLELKAKEQTSKLKVIRSAK